MKNHDPAFERFADISRARIAELDVGQVRDRLQSVNPPLLIDVREDHEWENGHIEGAQHIGKGIIERDIAKHVPQHDHEMVLYCGGGYRSALAADALQQMGYTAVYSMAGGYRAWRERSNG
jgi:rhodanese-related sulfurtransferase